MTNLITLVVSLIPVIGELFTNYFYLESLWEPNEIDWFANDDNHKLPVLYSRYWVLMHLLLIGMV
jgi:hypothetical protein